MVLQHISTTEATRYTAASGVSGITMARHPFLLPLSLVLRKQRSRNSQRSCCRELSDATYESKDVLVLRRQSISPDGRSVAACQESQSTHSR